MLIYSLLFFKFIKKYIKLQSYNLFHNFFYDSMSMFWNLVCEIYDIRPMVRLRLID